MHKGTKLNLERKNDRLLGCVSMCVPLSIHCVVADSNRRCKQIREEVCSCGYDPQALFTLLLNTSQFEFVMKEVKILILYSVLTLHTYFCLPFVKHVVGSKYMVEV